MKLRKTKLKKEHLLHQLSNAGTVFMLGWVSETFFDNEFSKNYLEKHGYSKSSIDYFKFLDDKDKKEIAFRGYRHSHWRALIKESFEVIQDYCKEKCIEDKFKANDWYPLVYVLRNGLSHDFRFDFSRLKKGINLPIKWKDIEITEKMDGEFIPSNLLSHEKVIDTFENMRKFVFELPE